ncbi:hypothetical protein GP486_000842 [Trichoglossum hirsutum]|uniref:Uncharacterized protein n=1 Tax=Trichoglossum hirsutum TaxID=265104 RepID=A0A9P8RTL5_9PEZI|nr:hypothetical protein GP486_000842 [Trichoglossum hirsutum]
MGVPFESTRQLIVAAAAAAAVVVVEASEDLVTDRAEVRVTIAAAIAAAMAAAITKAVKVAVRDTAVASPTVETLAISHSTGNAPSMSRFAYLPLKK